MEFLVFWNKTQPARKAVGVKLKAFVIHFICDTPAPYKLSQTFVLLQIHTSAIYVVDALVLVFEFVLLLAFSWMWGMVVARVLVLVLVLALPWLLAA